jgi:hypothetical protein
MAKVAKKVTKKVAKKATAKPEYGIKETQELLQLVFALGKTFKAAKQDDGNIDMLDIKHLVALFPRLTPAIEGVTEVTNELKDLSEAEVKTLLTFSAAHLGELAGEKEDLAEKIEKGLTAALAIVEFIKVLK